MSGFRKDTAIELLAKRADEIAKEAMGFDHLSWQVAALADLVAQLARALDEQQ